MKTLTVNFDSDNENLEVIDYNLTESESRLVSKTADKDKRREDAWL